MKIKTLLELNETIDKLFKKVQGFQGTWRHTAPENQVEEELISNDENEGRINLALDIMVRGYYQEISGPLEWDQVIVKFTVMPQWNVVVRTTNPFDGAEISEEDHSFEYDAEYDAAEAEAEEHSIEILSTWENLNEDI